ncbi:MAG: hypothetical protein EOM24_27410 [Chloroflexia bacterium]|nr:hypothetical protein [Chloroflexia bacterium]
MHTLNPEAEVVRAEHVQVPLDLIFPTGRFDNETTFNACLLTDSEMELGSERCAFFDDPFPPKIAYNTHNN